MIVTSFVYCDHIDVRIVPPPKKQIFSLVDPLQMIALFSLPGRISFSISVGLQGKEFVLRDNTFIIEIKDSDGESVLRTEPIKVEKITDKDLASENHGVVLNLDVRNFMFSKRGMYKSYLIVNGEEIFGEYPILVTKENE